MARLFDGVNDSLQAASVDLSGVNKFTLAFELYWDSFGTNDDLALEHTANADTGTTGWVVDPNSSSSKISIAHLGNVGQVTGRIDRPSAAAWHHYVIIFDKSASTNEIGPVYLDGSSVTVTMVANANNTNNFANSTLNFMSRNNASLFGAGRLANVAIWPGVLLDAAEAAALAKGVSPILIRPTSKPYYWPLIGRASPEVELFYGNTATVNGAVATPGPALIEPGAQAAVSIHSTTQFASFSGTLATAGTVQMSVTRSMAGSLSMSGAPTKAVTRGTPFAGTLASTGALANLKVTILNTGGTLATSGALRTVITKAASGQLSLSGDLTTDHNMGLSLAGVLNLAGAVKKAVSSHFAGTLVETGTLTNARAISPAGTLVTSGILTKRAGIARGGTLNTSGGLTKRITQALSGVLSFFGILRRAKSTGDAGTCELDVADLVARIYERLDDNGTYYTEPEVLHALDIIQRLFAWLTMCVEHRASFSLIGGQTFYSIRSELSDFWAPLRVSLQSNGARLLPMTLDDLDKLDEGWQSTPGTARYYCTMGVDFMAIYPQPAIGTSLHFTYAAEPLSITSLQSAFDVPSDQLPLLVDGAIWWLRLKEGGAESQATLEGFGRFVQGAKKYREYVQARSQAQLYDSAPVELTHFDLSRFMFRPQKKEKAA